MTEELHKAATEEEYKHLLRVITRWPHLFVRAAIYYADTRSVHFFYKGADGQIHKSSFTGKECPKPSQIRTLIKQIAGLQ